MYPSSREYSMSDAELMMFASNLVQYLTRDATELAEFGVTALTITAFHELNNQFEVFPPDTFFLADVSYAIEMKNNYRNSILKATRMITNRALVKWGEESSQYKKFGVKGLVSMSDKKLFATSRLVVLAATSFLIQLADEGLTQSIIDDYNDLAKDFEISMNAVASAIDIRDNKTKERIALGNHLYSLVTKYCTFGKTIWSGINETRYNDYIIYQKDAGSLHAPKNFFFDYISRTFYWDSVKHATSYQVQRSDGGEFVEIYAGGDTSFEFTPADGLGIYRVRARNMNGFGPFGEELEQWYYATLPAPTNVQVSQDPLEPSKCKITWLKVPTVTEYHIYRSVVNYGQTAADFAFMGITDETEFDGNLILGKRNYFRINATNGSQYSQSVPIWVEV